MPARSRAAHDKSNPSAAKYVQPKGRRESNAKCLKQNWQQETHPMKRQPLNLEGRTTQIDARNAIDLCDTAREYLTRQTQNWYIQNIPCIMNGNEHAIARTGKGCSKNYTHHTLTLPHETPKIRNHETLIWSHCTKSQNSTDIPSL